MAFFRGSPFSTQILLVCIGLAFVLRTAESRNVIVVHANNIKYNAINCRKHNAFLTEFGGIGDGKTINTKAFQSAISNLSQYESDGGSQLIVPPGKWLTGSFNITTSHFTLFLHKNAHLIASQDEADYPAIAPLPSYGDAAGGRFASLIFGKKLTDVVITGNNGTIDGQGSPWWDKFHKGQLKLTRPHLIELMFSQQVQISNITLINAPYWNVHPVYCSDVLVQKVTILVPVEVPNTNGINPDSCKNTKIEDCYILSGGDCIAVKSGLDQYGIKMGMPTEHLIIRRLTCIAPQGAIIALGSEMSGGIQDVRAEDITAINTESGVKIETAAGRGGFVKEIYVRRVSMKTMKYVFRMTGANGSHPDKDYDPKALPEIKGINYRDIIAENVTVSGALDGLSGHPFTGICISNVTITGSEKRQDLQWNCTNIEGISRHVSPLPCNSLPEKSIDCSFPTDTLPIDKMKFTTCTANRLW